MNNVTRHAALDVPSVIQYFQKNCTYKLNNVDLLACLSVIEALAHRLLDRTVNLLDKDEVIDALSHVKKFRARRDEVLPRACVLVAAQLDERIWSQLLLRHKSLKRLADTFTDAVTANILHRIHGVPLEKLHENSVDIDISKVGAGASISRSENINPASDSEMDTVQSSATEMRSSLSSSRSHDSPFTDADASEVLRCVHPTYTLGSDSITCICALMKACIDILCACLCSPESLPQLDASTGFEGVSQTTRGALATLLPETGFPLAFGYFKRMVALSNGQTRAPAKVTVKVKRLRGQPPTDVTASFRMVVSHNDPLATSIIREASKVIFRDPLFGESMYETTKEKLVVLYRGHAVGEDATPQSLEMPQTSEIFLQDRSWWNHKRRDEARRGQMVPARSNANAVRKIIANAAPRVQNKIKIDTNSANGRSNMSKNPQTDLATSSSSAPDMQPIGKSSDCSRIPRPVYASPPGRAGHTSPNKRFNRSNILYRPGNTISQLNIKNDVQPPSNIADTKETETFPVSDPSTGYTSEEVLVPPTQPANHLPIESESENPVSACSPDTSRTADAQVSPRVRRATNRSKTDCIPLTQTDSKYDYNTKPDQPRIQISDRQKKMSMTNIRTSEQSPLRKHEHRRLSRQNPTNLTKKKPNNSCSLSPNKSGWRRSRKIAVSEQSAIAKVQTSKLLQQCAKTAAKTSSELNALAQTFPHSRNKSKESCISISSSLSDVLLQARTLVDQLQDLADTKQGTTMTHHQGSSRSKKSSSREKGVRGKRKPAIGRRVKHANASSGTAGSQGEPKGTESPRSNASTGTPPGDVVQIKLKHADRQNANLNHTIKSKRASNRGAAHRVKSKLGAAQRIETKRTPHSVDKAKPPLHETSGVHPSSKSKVTPHQSTAGPAVSIS